MIDIVIDTDDIDIVVSIANVMLTNPSIHTVTGISYATSVPIQMERINEHTVKVMIENGRWVLLYADKGVYTDSTVTRDFCNSGSYRIAT
jgi:hypothetical protein